jgi:hypothetical protein
MAIITKEKLDKLADIIRRHVGWFLWRLFGEDFSSVDSSKVGVPGAAADKLPVSITHLSFILGEQEALLKESEWETYGWGDLDEAARKPLTELEQLQVKAAELSAYSAFRRLGEDIVNGLYDELAQTTGAVISESQVRGVIKDKIKVGVETNRAYFDVAKDLVGDLKEKKRNWYRVASTEMHKARQLGVANAIIGKKDIYRDSEGINSLVTIVPAPDACDDCKRLYLEAGGNPRIFKITELLSNAGSNYQRPWRKNAKPVVPPLHPHCFCRIRYAPPGWGWNKEGRFTLLDPQVAFGKKAKP